MASTQLLLDKMVVLLPTSATFVLYYHCRVVREYLLAVLVQAVCVHLCTRSQRQSVVVVILKDEVVLDTSAATQTLLNWNRNVPRTVRS